MSILSFPLRPGLPNVRPFITTPNISAIARRNTTKQKQNTTQKVVCNCKMYFIFYSNIHDAAVPVRFRIPAGEEHFLFSKAAVGPTEPPAPWVRCVATGA
jgi:hypothetical protein